MKYLLFLILTLFITINSFSIDHIDSINNLYASNINYPVRLTYIDKIAHWSSPQKIAAGMGVPGYAASTIFNYIVFAFWTHKSGPVDIAGIWADPIKYFGSTSVFGTTKDQIQINIKKKFNDAGIKILISAFGATQLPTTAKIDPTQCALKLGNFVLQNNLDGVDIDWQDNKAMQAGTGQIWVITFQKQLRKLLPSHLITHAPQAPYFKQQYYKNGGYITISNQVGSTIDFYNVQFYNQGDTKYDTYDGLFNVSTGFFNGTAVKEIIKRGIPVNKLIVGKPVTPKDADNTGWMDLSVLGQATTRAYNEIQWYGGVMFWQYSSDLKGDGIRLAAGHLKQLCAQYKNCI